MRKHVAEFTVSTDPDIADPGSEVALLTVDQPQTFETCTGLVLARAQATKATSISGAGMVVEAAEQVAGI